MINELLSFDKAFGSLNEMASFLIRLKNLEKLSCELFSRKKKSKSLTFSCSARISSAVKNECLVDLLIRSEGFG